MSNAERLKLIFPNNISSIAYVTHTNTTFNHNNIKFKVSIRMMGSEWQMINYFDEEDNLRYKKNTYICVSSPGFASVISFEEFFDNMPLEIRENILFNLDLF